MKLYGAPVGDAVSVTSGVSVGDRIVLKPTTSLRNGVRVRVASP
ncbi:MAG: hypothetical protein U1F34_05035 [Gammaproteobacteria bacterium]